MEWKTISEFIDYEINSVGQARHKAGKKILSQSLSTKEYYKINIGSKSRKTHRLLAIAFIPNPDNLETVNHKDGNKLNNDLTNLEWMSRSDNVKHSREVLGITPIPYSKSNKEHHLKGRKGVNSSAGKKIIAFMEDGSSTVYGSAYEAGEVLFGDREKGKVIRQSIKRDSIYNNIKFIDYGTN